MRIAFFSTKAYDERFFWEHNRDFSHDLKFLEARLNNDTVELARDFPAVRPKKHEK